MWPHANTFLKGYVNLWGKLHTLSHRLAIFGGHWSSASGFNFHVTKPHD